MVSGRIMNDAVFSTAIQIADGAAKTALAHFRQMIDIDLKSDDSPVTAADLRIEQEARAIIEANFSDHAILGEEFGSGDLTSEHVWVIDPIDGTRSFISGNPLFGFLLAYLERGRNVLSIISMPVLNERFVGRAGHGTTLNDVPVHTSGKTALSDAILFINEGEKLFAAEPDIHSKLVESGHTRRFAYDCYPHALLAAGHVDCVVDYDLKPFDFLPLAGVIEAAGGIITDWYGNDLTFRSGGKVVSSATPELHQEMLQLLSSGRRNGL